MNKSAILLVNDWWSQLTSTPYSCELFLNKKISTKKSWIIWSRTFDLYQFLTLNTASEDEMMTGTIPTGEWMSPAGDQREAVAVGVAVAHLP
jgi:hypothetical protein